MGKLKLRRVNMDTGEIKDETFADHKLPDVNPPNPHWKVGDGMNDGNENPDFIIAQMAMVSVGGFDFDLHFYDKDGVDRGDMKLRLRNVGD